MFQLRTEFKETLHPWLCHPPRTFSIVASQLKAGLETGFRQSGADVPRWGVPGRNLITRPGCFERPLLKVRLKNFETTHRLLGLFSSLLSSVFRSSCEAKSGEEGLNKAHRQNIHSASIAVRAVIELYKVAFGKNDPNRVSDLYGKILVFTVSHNHNIVYVYSHYAVVADDTPEKLEFYRYEIALFSLSLYEGNDRYKAYNFVRNVYEEFAPAHLQRIKDAVAVMKAHGKRTGLSFTAYDLALNGAHSQASSQDTPSQDDATFQIPGEPTSVAQKKALSRIRTQMDQQRQVNDNLQQGKDELRDQVSTLIQQ